MNISKAHIALKKAPIYKKWKEKNASSFVASFFRVTGDPECDYWRINCYMPEKDKLTSFSVNENKVRMDQKDVEILKRKETKVEPLDVDKVRVDLNEALEKTDASRRERYPEVKSEKKMILLQHHGELIWNITYLGGMMKVLNFKVSAETGKIVDESYQILFSPEAQ